MEWSQVAKIAKEALREGANQWIKAARISSGGTVINGPTLLLLSPCIGNNFDLEAFLVKSMTQSKVPTKLVHPIAEVLSDAWKSWPGSVSGSFVVFPAFTAWPGSVAKGMSTPLPLGVFIKNDPFPQEATILSHLTQDTAAFANAATGNRAEALKALATWVQRSYVFWKVSTLLVVEGEGPVPTFAPPMVPVGPVVGGKARSPATPFLGPPFGMP